MTMLLENGTILGDGSWLLPITVTDMNVFRKLRVRGDQHIGGLMLRLVEEIDVTRDWSDHALWWPLKRKWLGHTRSTLDQLGITADTELEFTPMHKNARIQLPDLQMIDARMDFSVNVVKATVQVCRELGIRYSEELSLKRYIPPDLLKRGLGFESDQAGPQPIRPGEESIGPGTLRRQTPISASASNLSGPRPAPAIQFQTGQVFNSSEAGTFPRGVSPAVNNTQISRPQNFEQKAAMNRGWLDSSRSLMEQGVFEGDVVLLRFKFMTFFDLNPKYDPVRINQLYEQAKWSVLLEEFDHTEEEAYMFAALQMQATLQAGNPEPAEEDKDDVDVLLDELEHNLDAAAINRRADIMQVPELAEYLKYFKPKKFGLKGFKRAYFSFRDLTLSYYDSVQQVNGPPAGHFSVKGCEVTPDVNLSQGKYCIKLLVPSAEGMSEFVLRCESESQYARWMAACRLASRGRTMADAGYNQEVDSIKKLLQMQSAGGAGGGDGDARRNRPSVQLPSDMDPDELIAQRYLRRGKSKQGINQRIGEAHNKVRTLSCQEAKVQYIRAWEALPEHGTHYFVVKFIGARKPELMGIAFNRLMRMNLDNGETVKTWRFSTMKKWHVNWEIRHVLVQFENEEIEFKPLSADCKVAHEFIGGYIFCSMRNKDQNQSLNEGLFQKLTGGWS